MTAGRGRIVYIPVREDCNRLEEPQVRGSSRVNARLVSEVGTQGQAIWAGCEGQDLEKVSSIHEYSLK